MQQVFLGLAALACPVGMGLMMWMMMRGQRGGSSTRTATIPAVSDQDRAAEIDALRAEIDQLKARRGAPRVGGN
jgi:hypothetical protein